MKVKASFITFVILVFLSSCGQAQNNTSEKQITMLKEFYLKHNSIWSVPIKTTPYDVLVKKVDSLNGVYCTSQLREKAKMWLEGDKEGDEDGGHDLLTNDFGGVMDQKTLSVIKDLTKSNEYIVSYTSRDAEPYGKEYTQHVTLHVTVVKEGENYKIDSVK